MTILTKLFDDCETGKAGVMPYDEGDRQIRFVWCDKGMGRIADIKLNEEGKRYAFMRYTKIEKMFELEPQNSELPTGSQKPSEKKREGF